jgi:hypothetical protein
MDEHYFEGLTKPLISIPAAHFHELNRALSPDSRLDTRGGNPAQLVDFVACRPYLGQLVDLPSGPLDLARIDARLSILPFFGLDLIMALMEEKVQGRHQCELGFGILAVAGHV